MAQSPRVPMLPSDSATPAICSASSPALMSCGHHGRLASTSATPYRSRSSSRSSSSAPSGAAVFSLAALPIVQKARPFWFASDESCPGAWYMLRQVLQASQAEQARRGCMRIKKSASKLWALFEEDDGQE